MSPAGVRRPWPGFARVSVLVCGHPLAEGRLLGDQLSAGESAGVLAEPRSTRRCCTAARAAARLRPPSALRSKQGLAAAAAGSAPPPPVIAINIGAVIVGGFPANAVQPAE